MATSSSAFDSILPDARLLYAGFILLAIGWLSLFVSYGLLATEAWTAKFSLGIDDWPSMTGAFIEGARALIFFAFFVTVLGPPFTESRRALFSKDSNFNWVYVARLIFVVFFTWFGYMVIQWHFGIHPGDTGPTELHEWAQQNNISSDGADQHKAVYAAFFPYSFILYVVISPFLIAVPFMAFGTDFRLLTEKARFAVSYLARNMTEKETSQAFRAYTETCLAAASRYLAPLGILVLLMVYDLLVGRFTVHDISLRKLQLGWAIVAVAGVYVFVVAWYFTTVLAEFKKRAPDIKSLQQTDVKYFFRQLFAYNLFGAIILGVGSLLLVLSTPWLKILGLS